MSTTIMFRSFKINQKWICHAETKYMTKKMEKKRCPWVNLNNPLYIKYHDSQWGKPVKNDRMHFEMLCLEGAQAGLSWETVLKKRARYKEIFFDFDPVKVSKMSEKKIEKALLDPGIIRNRLKIESMRTNAKAFIQIQKEFGSFNKYAWSFVNGEPIHSKLKKMSDYPATTKESDAFSKDLKKRGFKFVGSTIIYAYMQAIGMVNDHSVDCYLHRR